MSRTLRVVLDTNVVLSALLFRSGAAGRLRSAWKDEAFCPLISTATAQELIRVLTYPKFQLTANEQHELLADYLPYATSVLIPKRPPVTPECRDPFDLPFLHLAMVGKAGVLVSGDKDLLALAGTCKFDILTPAAFLDSL